MHCAIVALCCFILIHGYVILSLQGGVCGNLRSTTIRASQHATCRCTSSTNMDKQMGDVVYMHSTRVISALREQARLPPLLPTLGKERKSCLQRLEACKTVAVQREGGSSDFFCTKMHLLRV